MKKLITLLLLPLAALATTAALGFQPGSVGYVGRWIGESGGLEYWGADVIGNIRSYWRPGLTGTTNAYISLAPYPSTLNGGASVTAGVGYVFDGSNDYATAHQAVSNLFSANDSFSVSAWFKFDSTPAIQYIAGAGPSDADNFELFGISLESGVFKAIVRDKDNDIAKPSGSTLTTNVWYHGVLVWDTTTQVVQQYLNGVFDGSATNVSIDGNAYEKFSIGALDRLSTLYFLEGAVDEVTIFTTTLTANQIGYYYTNSFNGEFSGR